MNATTKCVTLAIVAISHAGPLPDLWHIYIHHPLLDIRYSNPHSDAPSQPSAKEKSWLPYRLSSCQFFGIASKVVCSPTAAISSARVNSVSSKRVQVEFLETVPLKTPTQLCEGALSASSRTCRWAGHAFDFDSLRHV